MKNFPMLCPWCCEGFEPISYSNGITYSPGTYEHIHNKNDPCILTRFILRPNDISRWNTISMQIYGNNITYKHGVVSKEYSYMSEITCDDGSIYHINDNNHRTHRFFSIHQKVILAIETYDNIVIHTMHDYSAENGNI